MYNLITKAIQCTDREHLFRCKGKTSYINTLYIW